MISNAKEINAFVRVDNHTISKMQKAEFDFYVNRQLFREVVEVLLKDKDMLPIELSRKGEFESLEELFKMSFIIIDRGELSEFERLAEIGRATEKAFKQELCVLCVEERCDVDECYEYEFINVDDLLDWANEITNG